MKKILLIVCLLCLASMCFAANTWTNSLKPKGTQETFVVYKNGEIIDPEQFYLLSIEDING